MIRTTPFAVLLSVLSLYSSAPLQANANEKQPDATITLAASTQQAKIETRCSREGTARIRLGQYLFFVPRSLLIHVDNEEGQVDRSWRCSNAEVIARHFFIDVRTNHAGQNFYTDWIEKRRLPRTIHVAVRGVFKNFLDQRYESDIEKGAKVETTASGLPYVSFPGMTYYNAGAIGLHGFSEQPIVYECSPRFLKNDARVCSTYYRFNEAIDLRYRFQDPPFVIEDWTELDARTRKLVLELMKPPVE